jgi:uncharacterized Zn-binding protein involved in type VI secretion
MIPSIATIGDMTTHGTPLFPGVGSINALISGKPVWRALIDFHGCPVSSGPLLHIGGTVLAIGKRVLVNGFPMAQQGDIIIENGALNTILVQ